MNDREQWEQDLLETNSRLRKVIEAARQALASHRIWMGMEYGPPSSYGAKKALDILNKEVGCD